MTEGVDELDFDAAADDSSSGAEVVGRSVVLRGVGLVPEGGAGEERSIALGVILWLLAGEGTVVYSDVSSGVASFGGAICLVL